ncbi:Do family serine endopeptidase [Marinimicrobium alkaliphilum]|uniref:Do family serine endopeptidase n=1 Tax=Marinimicrobium alkaliphilum TaxID=2202654 RepID=UPI000DBA4552|nr:Do family serine endopeptidase [Marinimicrobium alkaliphilum]
MQDAFLKSAVGFFVVWLLAAAQVSAQGLPEFTGLIEKSSPAVVKISTVERVRGRSQQQQQMPQQMPDIFRELFEPRRRPERDVRSMGSGFILSGDGYVVTNNHVIDNADEVVVRLIDRREYIAEVIGTDPRSDLALLKIDATDLPTLGFAEPDSLRVGQWVVAIGSPFGLDYSASAGIVSALGRSIPSARSETYVPFIQTDVAINPGNSGGPLFDLDGQVVGINSQIYTRGGGSIGLSFAIPSGVAQDVIAQLKEKGRVDRGWLGVVIQPVDKDLASSFGLDRPTGALINQVESGGPADEAGVRVGDVILGFGDADVLTSSDLPHLVGRTPPGTDVTLRVVREGSERELTVTVGTLAVDETASTREPGQRPDGTDRLGLVVEPVDERNLRRWQLEGGVLIRQVRPASPAAQASLMPGDVIVQIGYNEIDSVEAYEMLLAELPEDTLLPIRFFRNGRPAFRTITIPAED